MGFEIKKQRTSRRELLSSAAGVALNDLGSGKHRGVHPFRLGTASTAQDQQTPVTGAVVARLTPPAWTFTVHDYQDPYAGEVVIEPEEIPPGTRYVAADVEIDNASDQGLGFSASAVRVRDAEGFEYRPVLRLGIEPELGERTLNPGERARGWVWFAVPVDGELTQMVFYGATPEFRLRLPSA